MDEPWSGDCDQELVRRTAAGDDHAFEKLVDRYKKYALSIARDKARNCDTQEHFDIVQQTFCNVWHAIARGQYRLGGEFKHFLARVAQNTAITARRHKIVESKHIPGRLHASFDITSPEECPDQRLLDAELATEKARLIEQVESVLAQMAEREAVILRMKWMERKTLAEIGSVIGLSGSRVCILLGTARQHFRQLWRQAGFQDFA